MACILFVIRVKDERKYLAVFFLAFRLSMYVSLHSEIGNESEFQTIFEVNLEHRRHLSIAQTSLALHSVCSFFDILGKAKRDDTL